MLCFIALKKVIIANDIADEICTVYGSGTTITTIRNWFKRFKVDNFDFKDEDCSDRPVTTNTDLIKAMLAENPRYNMQEIIEDATNIK